MDVYSLVSWLEKVDDAFNPERALKAYKVPMNVAVRRQLAIPLPLNYEWIGVDHI